MFIFACIFVAKEQSNRFTMDNNDESKRSNLYNEQNLSNVVYAASDVKYNSFQ